MIIPVNGVDTLADYERRRELLDENIRPTSCPECKKEKTFWRHGKYPRKVFVGAECVVVHINRFKCGNCALVVSCIFSFIAPYVRFAASTVAKAVQDYSEAGTSYLEQAAELSELGADAPSKPSSTQVFRWVHRVVQRSESLLFQLQKELTMRNTADVLQDFAAQQSPSEKKARSEHKRQLLQNLAEFVQLARLHAQNGFDAVREIHAFFLLDVESLQSIFSGRPLRLPTPHSAQFAHW